MNDKDELYQSALSLVKSEGKASTSLFAKKIQIGYNRAARIIDMMEENGELSKANHVGKREILNEKVYNFFIIFFFLQNICSIFKKNVIDKFNKIDNISFNFIQTIDGKDEGVNVQLNIPKKFFVIMIKRVKSLVSNGSSLVIKNNKQYYRYLKNTAFEFILDKNFLINKIKSSKLSEIENKYIFVKINENNNNINIFFSKKKTMILLDGKLKTFIKI